MSFNLKTQYLRPVPHFLKFFSEVSSSENISYGIGTKEISAWDPADISNFHYLSCKNFGVTNVSLVSAELEDGSLKATVCSPTGVFYQPNQENTMCLSLQSNEKCVHLVKQNEIYIVATSLERLFVVDLKLSAIKELPSPTGGWMFFGLTRYARGILWEDPRKTVSLTKFESGLLHLTTTHAHIWDLVEADQKVDNIYQIRRSIQVLNTISSAANSSLSSGSEIVLLHAVFSNEILFVLALVGLEFVLFRLIDTNSDSQVKSSILRKIESHEVGNIGFLLQPIKICDDELYILFKDCVVLCSTDLGMKPVKLLERHVLGSARLSRSMIFYTPDGIYEHVNQKDEVEKKLFSELLSRFLSDRSLIKSANFSQPISKLSPSRILELTNEFCLSILDCQSTQPIIQAQLQDKTSKINSIFDFFAHLEYHYRFPIQDIKRLLFEYDEKLKFAALLRLELQKNDSTKSNFLYHVFYMMQRDPTKEVEAFSEDSSTEAFFSKISCVDDIIPVIVEYQRIELSRTPLALRIMFDLIVSACYFLNLLLSEPKKESKKAENINYIPIFALPSTCHVLKEQFGLIENFFSLLKQSNNSIQVKNTEAFDTLYSSANSIADLILSGYRLQMKSNPKDQPLQEEFKKNANSYISFFERSGKLRFAKIIAANYEIFDRLIGFSDEKELITHISTFGKSPEFVKCLYSHYLKLGKVSALLEDPLFHDYLKDNELLYSLHCLTREEYLSSYNKYVALSLNEKDLYERKRLVSMRKIIACQLDMNTKAEKQMLEIIKLQDPSHLKEMPTLRKFQDLLFQYHPKGKYIEPKEMIYTVLEHSPSKSLEEYVLLFQIFTFSTKLRNSSTKEASQIQLDIWTNCLQSTTWDELKFDKVRTDFDALDQEIKNTLLYQVGTHPKASFFFIPDIVERLLIFSKDDKYFFLIAETLKCIRKHNETARALKEDEERIEKLFFSQFCVKPKSNDDSLIFHNLLDSADIVSMQKALQKQALPLASNSLFYGQKPKQNFEDQALIPSVSHPPSLQRILKERNTLPLTLASLKAIPSKSEKPQPKPDEEERKNVMIDLPVMVKQDPQEIKLIPQSPMKSVPQSPLKLVPQSPLRFTNVSETSDTKQLNSPIKFQRKEFSLSESLIERGIEVFEEEKSGAFDGDIPDFEEINEKISSTIKKMTPTDSGSKMENLINFLEKNPSAKKSTLNRNDRTKK